MPSKPTPFDDFERMMERMSHRFDAITPTASPMSIGKFAVDVIEEDDQFIIHADLPGFDDGEIDVTIPDAKTVRIEAESQTEVHEEEGEEEMYIRRERTKTSVSRTLTLPESFDETETTATYDNGVLTVELPKEFDGDNESRKIEVE